MPKLAVDVQALVRRGADWSEMVDLIDTRAPYGFLIYFRNDVPTVMQAAGDRAEGIAYLMGSHVIAERMFRHDPRAMLYAPLHTVIWEDADGEAWFTVDQPSTQISRLGIRPSTRSDWSSSESSQGCWTSWTSRRRRR